MIEQIQMNVIRILTYHNRLVIQSWDGQVDEATLRMLPTIGQNAEHLHNFAQEALVEVRALERQLNQ